MFNALLSWNVRIRVGYKFVGNTDWAGVVQNVDLHYGINLSLAVGKRKRSKCQRIDKKHGTSRKGQLVPNKQWPAACLE